MPSCAAPVTIVIRTKPAPNGLAFQYEYRDWRPVSVRNGRRLRDRVHRLPLRAPPGEAAVFNTLAAPAAGPPFDPLALSLLPGGPARRGLAGRAARGARAAGAHRCISGREGVAPPVRRKAASVTFPDRTPRLVC